MTSEESRSILDGNPNASAAELAPYFTARSGETKGGYRYVTARQISGWYDNRARNGFPGTAGTKRWRGRRSARAWNVEQAWEWFKNYEPSKGGAPKGNRNAVKHGRCVGMRAAREAARFVSPTP